MEIVSFPAVASLADLRRQVLRQNPKRMPKWGFRLDAACVLQLQPKPCLLITPLSDTALAAMRERFPDYRQRQPIEQFEGRIFRAIDGDVPATVFRDWTPPRDQRWLELRIVVHAYEDAPSVWELRDQGGRYARAIRTAYPHEKAATLQWLATAFTDGRFDQFTPELMLRPACLICGKALTDPASMARWIGPECAESASLTIRGLFHADDRYDGKTPATRIYEGRS